MDITFSDPRTLNMSYKQRQKVKKLCIDIGLIPLTQTLGKEFQLCLKSFINADTIVVSLYRQNIDPQGLCYLFEGLLQIKDNIKNLNINCSQCNINQDQVSLISQLIPEFRNLDSFYLEIFIPTKSEVPIIDIGKELIHLDNLEQVNIVSLQQNERQNHYKNINNTLLNYRQARQSNILSLLNIEDYVCEYMDLLPDELFEDLQE